MATNFVTHGKEDIYLMEKAIHRYREEIKELHAQIAGLKIERAEVQEIEH